MNKNSYNPNIQILEKQAYSQQNTPTFSVKKLDDFAWQTLAIGCTFRVKFSINDH